MIFSLEYCISKSLPLFYKGDVDFLLETVPVKSALSL